jgi:flagellar hook-associated protein 1 FlgK|tara:strand:- start:7661 stop:9523 length:1863 start_codon:yes stop_codon:yes gene_type:complete
MNDLFHIGASGLRAFRAALDVTGGNVANADTPGYTRRSAQISALPTSGASGLHYADRTSGSGATVDGILRQYDTFLAAEVRTGAALQARDTAASRWLGELESALGTQETGLAAAYDRFYSAATDLAASPNSLSARTLLLEVSGSLAESFGQTGTALGALESDITGAMKSSAAEANTVLRALADINDGLLRAKAGSATEAGLLDQRDQFLSELAEFVPIHVEENSFGQFSVRLDNGLGQHLLTPSHTSELGIGKDPHGTPTLFLDANFAPREIDFPASGELAGQRQAWEKLSQAGQDLDKQANRFAQVMNDIHAEGVDLAGERGKPLFATDGVGVVAQEVNRGDVSVNVKTDGSALAVDGYQLVYDSAIPQWTLSRTDGTAQTSGLGMLTLDGMQVELYGNARNGDRFVLTPETGAAHMRLEMDDPADLAMAAAFQVTSSSGFAGGATLSVDDAAALSGTAPHRFTWTAADEVQITDANDVLIATEAFVPGMTLEGAGYSLTVSGQPAVGDTLTVSATPAGYEDNSNLQAMLARGDTQQEAFEERFAQLRTRISSSYSEAQRRAEVSAIVAEQSAMGLANAQGVNLDEEAANLVRYQQGYQASTRIIAAASEMFDSLLAIG